MNDLMPMLDTHQHLIYLDHFRYSWTDSIPTLAGKSFTYDDYVWHVKHKGVAGALFMESAPNDAHSVSETKLACELAAAANSMTNGVIATCRPEIAGIEKYVESVADPKIVGFRRIHHTMPDETSQSPTFAENVRWLGSQGYTFDLCYLARQLPIAYALAARCPDTQFILDHCGVPDIAAGQMDPWRQHIKQLASLPNVACKLSGLPTYCKTGQATYDVIQPWADHCINTFGAERMVWGGDWPVCTINTTFHDWIDLSRKLVANLSPSEQRRVLHDNALRIYKIKI